ncbi:hypothetical protein AB5J56_40760 [Streptomyces sp. R21]|uniref:Uncharacterized protein n=1 Tax=Streptomyces sp. R21 TaxID=3238627 RepID=A0AB39PJK6_9ACTN
MLLDFVHDSALPMVLTYETAAARAGHSAAQRTLGFMYRTARGVEADAFLAEVLFRCLPLGASTATAWKQRRTRSRPRGWFLAMLDRGNGDGIHEAIQLVKQGMTDEPIRTAGQLAGRPSEAETLIHTTRKHGG